MMQLTRHGAGGHYLIRAAEPGLIRIDEETFTDSLVLAPEKLIPDWPVHSIAELTQDHLHKLLEMCPDVVLIGTGETLTFPEQWVFAACYERGIGLEVMDTAAACRTYNVLVSEERNVVAGLML